MSEIPTPKEEYLSPEIDPFRLNNFVHELPLPEQESIKQNITRAIQEGDFQSIETMLSMLRQRSENETIAKESGDLKNHSEILIENLPIVILRWFPNGEGWAYNIKAQNQAVDIMNSLSNILYSYERKDKIKGLAQMANSPKWIIYEIHPDIHCKDPKAKNRSPFYLTAVVTDRKPNNRELETIYHQIDELPEIEEKGKQSINIGKNKKQLWSWRSMVSGIPVKVFPRNNRAGARLSITKENPYKTSNSRAVFINFYNVPILA